MSDSPTHLQLPGVEALFLSEPMRRLMQMVERVARHNAAVLIVGETGSGKELIARAVHYHSLRAEQPWVDVNCGALPEHLVESELFGYEKGAFSGADTSKPGFFELANKGTLFLDEVGELEQRLQVKLLRVLDGSPYYRLGGTKKVTVDVRLVAATNRDLELAVKEGRFRGDLYHRISQFQLRVPPLRERKDDILVLAAHFLNLNHSAVEISDDAANILLSYSWPGNVRELRNVMMRAGAMCSGDAIRPADLPEAMVSPSRSSGLAIGLTVEPASSGSQPSGLRDQKKQRIIDALARHGGHQGLAAEELGISRRTLSRQLKQMRSGAPQASHTPNLGLISERQQNYFRSTLQVPIEMRISGGPSFQAESSNVSIGGMAIEKLPPEGQRASILQFSFMVPEIQKTIRGDAEIAWCTSDGRAGLKFLKLDPASSTDLKRWILQKQLEEGWHLLR